MIGLCDSQRIMWVDCKQKYYFSSLRHALCHVFLLLLAPSFYCSSIWFFSTQNAEKSAFITESQMSQLERKMHKILSLVNMPAACWYLLVVSDSWATYVCIIQKFSNCSFVKNQPECLKLPLSFSLSLLFCSCLPFLLFCFLNSLSLFYFRTLQILPTLCNTSKTRISLGFVLDSTGSMEEEINAVKSGVRTILNLNSSLISKFVMVAYRDPNIINAHNSSDRQEIEANLDKLLPYAGSDCPEMAMLGLRKAVELSDKNSVLLFFSDASAKDYADAPKVTKLAEEKNVTILFFITGCCDDCKSESFRSYEVIAKATKGRLYRIRPFEAKTVRTVLWNGNCLVLKQFTFRWGLIPQNDSV